MSAHQNPAAARLCNFIDGEDVAPLSGRYLLDIEPATGMAIAEVPDSDERDIARAVAAAERAFPVWSRTTAAERSRRLLAIADGIADREGAFAAAESRDTGKPIALARSLDIPRAIANFRFFATAILHTHTEAHATDATALNITLRKPRGVAGLVSPWNLPLYLLSWKIAPALATGNTAVAKPSELTPTTASMLAQVCREAGLPRGVLNIVHGTGPTAGAALVAHPRVPALSFTGGTATGREIARVAGPLFKRVALELGGKNPFIVFDDADLDATIPVALRAAFANQGQICLCGSRLLVARSIFDAFLDRFVEGANALVVGDPNDASTEQGALISAGHREKVASYVAMAIKDGGRVLCGGGPPETLPKRCRDGFFYRPTVITGVDHASRVNQEEIFGPVVTVTPFDDEDGALRLANGTRYGLAASIWTRDLARAHRFAERLDAGTVWVNCWLLRDLRVPFGGVKESGVGLEGGDEALRFFTETKNVCVHFPSERPEHPHR